MPAEKVYSGRIDLSVVKNSHTKLCERILEDGLGIGKRVLGVGCSEGYLGATIKAFCFEVWGVELSATTRNKLKTAQHRPNIIAAYRH